MQSRTTRHVRRCSPGWTHEARYQGSPSILAAAPDGIRWRCSRAAGAFVPSTPDPTRSAVSSAQSSETRMGRIMANQDNNPTGNVAARPNARPPLVSKAGDFDALRASVVDAASVSGGLWITYLTVLFYLLIAIGSVTHKDMFLQSPIRLPFMNVDLPMTGFFWFGPALFLIVHAYVLLHFVMLAHKVGDLDRVLVTQVADLEEQTKLRGQLPANIFIQLLAGPIEVRNGLIGICLWLIALISLVIGPVLLLMFFEVQFLPYHSGPV